MIDRDVIFISNALANGGAARVLCLLANHFATEGYSVGVLAFNSYDEEFSLESQIDKEYGPGRKGDLGTSERIRWINNVARRNPRARIVAFEYFVNMQALIACIGLPNMVVVSERNDPARVGSHFPIGFFRKLLYRKAYTLVCQTDEAASHFSDKINKRVILNPIKPDLSEPIRTETRSTVVTFCRLEKQKNLGMLVRAFFTFHKQHPDYSLEIYGDGTEYTPLVTLVESLSLADCVFIYPARSDIHEVVKDCAMFVLPSDYEGLSNSMIEAMALGLPTICTDCPCGGARTVIENGVNGLLVPVGDESALVQAMNRVANNKILALRLGEAAAGIRNDLSLENISSQWKEVIFDGGHNGRAQEKRNERAL